MHISESQQFTVAAEKVQSLVEQGEFANFSLSISTSADMEDVMIFHAFRDPTTFKNRVSFNAIAMDENDPRKLLINIETPRQGRATNFIRRILHCEAQPLLSYVIIEPSLAENL